MRYHFFLIIALMLIGCNSNKQNAEQKGEEVISDKCFVYPSPVDSLQLKDLYDSAKWYIYTMHCDDNYLPKKDTSKSIPLGQLPLKFDNLMVKHDTVEVNFYFMDEQQPILPSMTRDVKELLTGVGFDMKTRQKIYMLSPNGYSYYEKGGPNRYENPLQLEVVTFIKDNWNKLDVCFKDLAQRKGVIK